MATNDPRYQHVQCATCGNSIQRIDFYGNPHVTFCSQPKADREVLPDFDRPEE